jgi:hypothetical protein
MAMNPSSHDLLPNNLHIDHEMHEPQLGQINIGWVNQHGKRKHLFKLFSGWSRRLDLLVSATVWGTIPIRKATESKLVTTTVQPFDQKTSSSLPESGEVIAHLS